jgi:hypothetical protein
LLLAHPGYAALGYLVSLAGFGWYNRIKMAQIAAGQGSGGGSGSSNSSNGSGAHQLPTKGAAKSAEADDGDVELKSRLLGVGQDVRRVRACDCHCVNKPAWCRVVLGLSSSSSNNNVSYVFAYQIVVRDGAEMAAASACIQRTSGSYQSAPIIYALLPLTALHVADVSKEEWPSVAP